MRTAKELLSNYAEYHRDRRNIATHFVGIPMIVSFGCGSAFAAAHSLGSTVAVSSDVTWVLTTVFYLSRHLVLGAQHRWHTGLRSGLRRAA